MVRFIIICLVVAATMILLIGVIRRYASIAVVTAVSAKRFGELFRMRFQVCVTCYIHCIAGAYTCVIVYLVARRLPVTPAKLLRNTSLYTAAKLTPNALIDKRKVRICACFVGHSKTLFSRRRRKKYTLYRWACRTIDKSIASSHVRRSAAVKAQSTLSLPMCDLIRLRHCFVQRINLSCAVFINAQRRLFRRLFTFTQLER